MDHQLQDLIAQYGIYAVFALCTVEGDITLLISGTMAHGGFFGNWGFLKVFFAGTLGGVAGDCAGYAVGRIFHANAKDYRFYQVAQPRVERLIEKFGSFAIIISKYIYGIRVAVCLSYGVSKMPFVRFLGLSALSCSLWVLLLSGLGYFFSGAVTSMIGDFKQVGFVLFFVVMFGVIIFYVLERYWISERVEAAAPETIQKIEEKLHAVEEVAQEKFHDLSERFHLTREPNRAERSEGEKGRKDEEEREPPPTNDN
ncbi:MAG: DedA family protein [Acidobacteria bacterium]|nr:DedA family protein [Acidobacteriota bacterium]MBK9529571.1 DedA family protein [Acidobacteriota bacterium]MBP7473647.1 DedA family protein [Pyrinomonadaceae bacterium]MBP9108171.1 DedA family protein [Pyrinomonadaceae bacterium]